MPAIDDLAAIRRLLDAPPPAPAVTEAGRARLDQLMRHDPGRRRPHRSRARVTALSRRVGILAPAGAVAAVAAVATTLALVHQDYRPTAAAQPTSTRQAGAGQTGQTPPASVQRAILTAIGSADGDVMCLTVTTTGGPPVGRGVVQSSWWPAHPSRGQRVHLITSSPATREEVTFTEPAVPPGDLRLKLLPASGYLLDPAGKTWQPVTRYAFEGVFAQTTANLLEKGYLRATLLPRSKVVDAHATVLGRPAIEISVPAVAGLSVTLWVDAQTYLPLRMVKVDAGTTYPATRKVYDYQFLPATAANLAPLTAPVPAGYQQHDWP